VRLANEIQSYAATVIVLFLQTLEVLVPELATTIDGPTRSLSTPGILPDVRAGFPPKHLKYQSRTSKSKYELDQAAVCCAA